jgi:O-Antigen ligase
MLAFLPGPIYHYALILIALIGAALLLRTVNFATETRRAWLLAWLVVTTAAFFSGHFLVFAVVVLVVCAKLRGKWPEGTPAIYVALLPIIPLYDYTIPGLLGIESILTLDLQRVLALTLLLPAVMVSKRDARPLFANPIDVFAVLYFSWLVVLGFVFRPSFTDALRNAVETWAFLALPYFAISRLIRTMEDMKSVIVALVFTGIVMSVIGFVEQRMTQVLYLEVPKQLHMNPLAVFAAGYEFRFGFLRIRSSIEGGLGYALIFSLAALLCVYRLRILQGWRFWLIGATLVVAIFFTGSRGAWMAAAIAVAVSILFPLIRSPGRFVFLCLLAIVCWPTVQQYLLSARDEFGTFEYRSDLLKAAIPVIMDHPVMGWGSLSNVFASGKLEHMRQGQGIIDIVNSFIGEALTNGISGLFLFVSVIASSIWCTLRRYHQSAVATRTMTDQWLPAFLVSLALCTVVYLGTISMVGHIPVYFWLLIALCSAYSSMNSVPDSDERGKEGFIAAKRRRAQA